MNLRTSSLAAPHPPATLDALNRLVGEGMAMVNHVIFDSVTQDVPLINDIARHIISAGGKRLRPALTIACAMLCGYTGDRHVHLAAAVELIHTATLLHDDVVDESTLRRGDQTANAIWSNQASVLVGDFLLSRAFQLMVRDGSLEVLRILSDASATISQGEVMQLMAANDPSTTEARYLEVIAAKTATLFEAACQLGGVIMGSRPQQEALARYGHHLGMAFQLVDDALDYAADERTLGKSVGDDFREGKITLPVLIAYHAGSSAERGFWQRVLEQQDQRSGDFEQALSYIRDHRSIELTVARAAEYCAVAQEALHDFPDNNGLRAALIEALDFCIQRAY